MSTDPTEHRPLEPIQGVNYNPYEPTSPYGHGDIPIPPPPMQRHNWLLVTLIAVILGGILFVVVRSYPAQHSTHSTPTTAVTSTTVVTPAYERNLSSTNFNLFINAFSKALQQEDVQSIEAHTDTLHFTEYCASGSLPNSPQGCENDWQTVKRQIASDLVRFYIPADASLVSGSNICGQFRASTSNVIVGNYDNAGFTLPLPHIGQAYFEIACVTCGSETTWGWQSVMLC